MSKKIIDKNDIKRRKNFGLGLKELLKQSNMTQKELAGKIGIHENLVSLGYSNFTYYTTQDCTEKIALPFQNTIDEIWCIVSK